MFALSLWLAWWCRKTAPITEDVPWQRPDSHSTLAVAMLSVASVAGLVRALVLARLPRTTHRYGQVLMVLGLLSWLWCFGKYSFTPWQQRPASRLFS